jgi:hypothetical protein
MKKKMATKRTDKQEPHWLPENRITYYTTKSAVFFQ